MKNQIRLKGRVLKREVPRLEREYREIMRPLFEQARASLADRAFDVISGWASRHYPAADMDVCERYGVVAHVEGVNVECRDAESDERSRHIILGRERYGLPFPEGKTLRIPRCDPWVSEYASVVWCGPEDSHNGRVYAKNVPELGPLVAYVREKVDEFEGGAKQFEAYVATRPLRRELAKRYPAVARRVWPDHLKGD